MAQDVQQSEHRNEPHFLSWLLTNRVTLGLAGLIAFLTAFYVEEDIRGKMAWQRCRRQMQATGQMLDWNALVPPRIPDAENIFSAPKIKDWFVKGGSADLTGRMSYSPLSKYLKQHTPATLAKVIMVPFGVTNELPDADIVLRYRVPILSLAPDASTAPSTDPASEVIPLIVMDAVPLADAIRNLAQHGGIKYSFAPEVAAEYVSGGKPQPFVTLRWEKVTARQALASLLANYGLRLVDNSKTGIALITKDDSSRGQPQVYVDAEVSERLAQLIRAAIDTNNLVYLNGSQGIKLLRNATATKTFCILLKADKIPSPSELKQFFPADALKAFTSVGDLLSVQPDGSNSVRVLLTPYQTTAADYLAWSDQFQPDFDLIREALKRPSARIDGDYSQPFSVPILNFVAVRMNAQTLAQRAQCYLLLGEPDNAVRELRLLHDLNRLLHTTPTTLVAAMIEVAVSGLYVEVVADGFRLGSWREPHLAVLEEQLREVNLLPQVRSAFLAERAGICRLLESQSAAKIQSLTVASTPKSLWQRLQDPKTFLLTVAPHGWNQQNMVVVAKLNQKYLDAFDAERQVFSPPQLNALQRDLQTSFNHINPQNFLAAICVPNFSRACQTLARTQTRVNEAFLACALERYRLAHGSFPEGLALLAPAFVEKVPSDLIGGQSLHYRRKDAEHFQLYSVGWNEIDDGGATDRNENGSVVWDQGDWVWDPVESGR